MLRRFTTPFLFLVSLFSVIGVFIVPAGTALASVQVTTGKWTTSAGGTTRYIPIHGTGTNIGQTESVSLIATPMSVAGSFATLRVVIDYAPGGSDTARVTLWKNAVATALTCTVTGAATTCSDVTNSVSVVQGDKLTYEIVWSASALHSTYSAAMNFTPTTANETFLTTLVSTLTTTAESYGALSPYTSTMSLSASQTTGKQLFFPQTGTLDKFVASSTAPGAGKTWDFTLLQNTSTSTVTCQVNGNSPNWCADNTHAISIATNDLLTIASVPTGTPTATNGGFGARFVPTVPGDFNFFTFTGGADSGSATSYHAISGAALGTVLAASSTQVVNAMTIKTMSVAIDTAPTGVKTRVFTLDVNNLPTAATCTITGTAKTCTWTASSTNPPISVNDGDVLDTSDTPTGTPGVANVAVSLIANTSSPVPPTVTTQAASGETATATTLNGDITVVNGFTASVRGFAWGTSATLSGGDTATTTDTSGQPFSAGAFTGSLSSLTCNTTYYARAYATNPMGDGLGSIETFTTSVCPESAPTVTTQAASSLTKTTATLNGNITATGNVSVTVRGFAYGTDETLTTTIATTTDTTGQPFSTGAFIGSISSLTCNTTYYARAYATNSIGDGLGSIQSFTPSCGPLPYFIPTRLSGVAPLGVFFDTASSTAASTTDITVTSRPFHDLDYSWDFNDPTAGNWTYGTASSSKNIAYGPEAAHVFETPGTYTVTMTVKDGTDTAATTTTITVTDPDTVFSGTNTICFSAAGTFTDCPSGAMQITTSTFDTALATYQGPNKRLLFNRGDTFTSTADGTISSAGPLTVGAYGTGALPIINVTNLLTFKLTSTDVNDLRIMDLEIIGSDSLTTEYCMNVTALVSNVTVLRLTCHNINSGIIVSSGSGFRGSVIQDSHIYNLDGNGVGNGGMGIFGRASYSAYLGNFIGPFFFGAEHGIRLQPGQHVAISHNTVTTPGTNGKSTLTIRAADHLTGSSLDTVNDTQYVYASDNHLIGNGADDLIQVAPASNSQNNWVYDVLVERNWLELGTGSTARAVIIEASSTTFRNNICNATNSGISGAKCFSIAPTNTAGVPAPNNLHFYNNTCYTSTEFSYLNNSNFQCIYLDASVNPITNTVVENNLAYAPNSFLGGYLPKLLWSLGAGVTGTTGASGTYGNSSDTQVLNTSPLFANPSGSFSLFSDFQLQGGSYALAAGTSILGVLYDFGRTLRQAVTSMGAFDLNPPTLTTQAASTLAATSATLNGTITITGGANATQSGFAYGTSATLATVIATSTLGAQSGTASFTDPITGLSAATTYYFRPYATNSVGTSYGSILSFTTDAGTVVAPTLTTDAATSITPTDATLNGTVTDLGGANVTVSGFAYGTDATLATVISTTTDSGAASSVPTSFTSALSSLTCATAYYARAYATNSEGDGLGTIETFTTDACPSSGAGGVSNSQQGTITVTAKVINDNNGTTTAFAFPLFVGGTPVTSGVVATFYTGGLYPYLITETPHPQYTHTFSGDCDSTGLLYLAPGDHKACTITNNDRAPATTTLSTTLAPNPSGLSEAHIQSILSLLTSFGIDEPTLASVTAALRGTSAPLNNPQSGLSGDRSAKQNGLAFTRNLQLHQTGADVKALQQYLNQNGFTIAQTGPGSPGNETTTFGMATYRSLVKFQTAHNLPGTGYFGPLTRKVIENMSQ